MMFTISSVYFIGIPMKISVFYFKTREPVIYNIYTIVLNCDYFPSVFRQL